MLWIAPLISLTIASDLVGGRTSPGPPVASANQLAISPYMRPVGLQPVRAAVDALTTSLIMLRGDRNCVVGRDVEVRESRGRGLGLYALRDYREREAIGLYSGVVVPIDTFNAAYLAGLTTGNYLGYWSFNAEDRMPLVIDAEDPFRSSPTRYINHSLRRKNCQLLCLPLGGPFRSVCPEASTTRAPVLTSVHG